MTLVERCEEITGVSIWHIESDTRLDPNARA